MLAVIGLILVIAGFVLVLAAALILLLRAFRGEGKARGVAVVLVGPIPLLAATDREMVKWGVVLTVVAALLTAFLATLALLSR